MAGSPGSTQALKVLDGAGVTQQLAEVYDPNNTTASARATVAVQIPGGTVTSTAAAAAKASASVTAGATGVKNVCTAIYAQINGDATGNADFGTWTLRDGATGAGTVLMQGQVSVATGANATGTPFALSGLNIAGSAATAMTLEFTAAGATHSLQTVSMSYYQIS